MENISLEVSNKSVIIAQNENGEWVDVGKQRRILIRRKIKH